ncbi:adenylosuccinate synthase [Olivibacter ginsenosidimutans]|uniref:Adenylosuccinate synthetase n=1 Tax=Olivibacter ginsenosidimutans TaxID=1176537 RepID=A0ABP9AXY3_9SPHI
MANCDLVIDLGFGDAGKGHMVDYLLEKSAADRKLVVRFSGGHQVGHTVVQSDIEHTFSNFGSGTLQGVPTYYSEHTTIFPPGIHLEGEQLQAFRPHLFIHPLTMVSTPYDILYNRFLEKQQDHGSCGLGFGATVERNRAEVHFHALDLMNRWMIRQRLNSIRRYYEGRIAAVFEKNDQQLFMEELAAYDEELFIDHCLTIQVYYTLSTFNALERNFDYIVFEGSQGIMLDTQFGIYPHTTWSHTSTKNALDIIRQTQRDRMDNIQVYYLTRCYQTRHGNGPMSTAEIPALVNNETETNITNAFQGDFRIAKLDEELLRYALHADALFHEGYPIRRILVLTCLDQLPDFSVEVLLDKLAIDFDAVLGSYGRTNEAIRTIR